MFTLYSRLGNIQLPEDEEKVRKWTKEEWERHAKWLDSRACAKPLIKCDPKPREWRPLKKLQKRLKTLAKPKSYPVLVKTLEFNSTLTKISIAAKEYMATDRICSLSRPKDPQSKYKPEPHRNIPVESSKDIPVPERTAKLAHPKVVIKNDELKVNPFGVQPKALKANASDRIKELAQPKQYSED